MADYSSHLLRSLEVRKLPFYAKISVQGLLWSCPAYMSCDGWSEALVNDSIPVPWLRRGRCFAKITTLQFAKKATNNFL